MEIASPSHGKHVSNQCGSGLHDAAGAGSVAHPGGVPGIGHPLLTPSSPRVDIASVWRDLAADGASGNDRRHLGSFAERLANWTILGLAVLGVTAILL